MAKRTSTPDTKNIRKRGNRLSRTQFDHLIRFMDANKAFANSLFTIRAQGKDTPKKLWTQLTAQLNSLGISKSVSQWQKVWTDIKYKTTLKFNKLRLTNNADTSAVIIGLSEADKRVLRILQIDLGNPSSWAPVTKVPTGVLVHIGKIIPLEEIISQSEQLNGSSEVVPADNSSQGPHNMETCFQEGEIQNVDSLPINDGEENSSIMIQSVESIPALPQEKRMTLSELDEFEPRPKRLRSFMQKPQESFKNENEMIIGLLNSQQETMHVLLNSQREMMHNLMSSQEKLVQSFQKSQQDMTRSVMDYLTRRADLDERVIQLEEEKLKVIERRVTALEEVFNASDTDAQCHSN